MYATTAAIKKNACAKRLRRFSSGIEFREASPVNTNANTAVHHAMLCELSKREIMKM